MVVYNPPANFKKDKESGWYYQKLLVTDADRPIRHYIWFDPMTGRYFQKSFPDVPVKTKTKKGFFIILGIVAVFLIIFLSLHFVGMAKTQTYEEDDLKEAIGLELADPEDLQELTPYEGNLILNEGGDVDEN